MTPRPRRPSTRSWLPRACDLAGVLLLLLLVLPMPLTWGSSAGPLGPSMVLAGPVDWQELPATAEGTQAWDAGSLRGGRDGTISVLSRFRPAQAQADAQQGSQLQPGSQAQQGAAGAEADPATRPRPATLYVMELDCGGELYRDISVNGFPRFRAAWRLADEDPLALATLRAACAAWTARTSSVAPPPDPAHA